MPAAPAPSQAALVATSLGQAEAASRRRRVAAESNKACLSIFFIVSQPSTPLHNPPQVDDRLAGEGTGKALGVSGPEGWALPLVFGAVWALYYGATREIGDGPAKGGSGDDSGLSL